MISLLTKFLKNSVHPSLADLGNKFFVSSPPNAYLGERAATLRERIDLWSSEVDEEPKPHT